MTQREKDFQNAVVLLCLAGLFAVITAAFIKSTWDRNVAKCEQGKAVGK